MKFCKTCGGPEKSVKIFRELRLEIENVKEKKDKMEQSKKDEIGARRAIEGALQKAERKTLKYSDRYEAIKSELESIQEEFAKQASTIKKMESSYNELEENYIDEMRIRSDAERRLGKIKRSLAGLI